MRALLLVAAVICIVVMIVGLMVLIGRNGSERSNGTETASSDSLEGLLDVAEGSGTIDLKLDTDTIEEAFLLYNTAPHYYRTCNISHSYGNTVDTQKKVIIRDGDRCNIKTYRDGVHIETLICDGANIFVRDEILGSERIYSISDGLSPAQLASLPDHERVLSLIKGYQSDSETSELSRVTYAFQRTSDLNVLVLTLSFENGASEKYYYYLDNGIIYHAEKSISSLKTYSMTTSDFSSDISAYVDENTFTIPNEE